MIEQLVVLNITKIDTDVFRLYCQLGIGGRVVDRIVLGHVEGLISPLQVLIVNTQEHDRYDVPVILVDGG